MKKIVVGISIVFVMMMTNIYGAEFTREDRDRLIRVEVKLEQLEKRIVELREDMNKRFEEVDRRFEQVDKRFEQVDKRFEQMMIFLSILAGIFATITVGVIGFEYWDRRTIIRKSVSETIITMEREGNLHNLIEAMKEYAKKNKKLAEILHEFHII